MASALALPHIVRWIVVTRLHAMTGRLVRVESTTLSLREGRLTVRGLHVADRDGATPFVDVARLGVRVSPTALLRRHVWIRELTIVDPAVRVVRLSSNEFNLSDLVRASGSSSGPGAPPDVTVDRFTVAGGTVTLEDRALPDSRTWRSEHISIEARDVSTRHAGGTAVASSVTGGAPVTVDVQRLRLYPIDFAATVAVHGADLALARLYMPADAPAVLDRGRADLSADVMVHASEGIRVDATAHLADVALTRPEDGRPVLQAPLVAGQLGGLRVHEAGARVGRFEITSSLTAFDPRVSPAARFELPGVRASATDVTWPLSEPARIELRTGVPGGGLLTVAGILRTAPAPSDVRVRLAKLDLAPWVRYLPPRARITGVAEADLRVNEPITAGLPIRVRGSIAVNNVGISGGRQKLVGARRIEATGLHVDWPTRIGTGRLLIDQPVALVERDRSGQFPLHALVAGPSPSNANGASTPESTASSGRPSDSSSARPNISVQIGQIAVRNGSATWRDQAVTPPVHLTASRINASVKGSAWPLSGPLDVALDLEPPGGGELRIAGTADVRQPMGADVRVLLKSVEVGAYQSYLRTPARVGGRADADVTVRYDGADAGVAVRGQAAVARLDVRDPERTVVRVERATATGLDVQWPERVSIHDVTLQRPWVLLERDERGQLPLPALLPATRATPADGSGGKSEAPGTALAVAVQRLGIESGGARIVDRGIQPPFAVDLDRLTAEFDGLSTDRAGKPARISLTGRIAPDAALALQGSVGPLGGPLRVDLRAEVRDFA